MQAPELSQSAETTSRSAWRAVLMPYGLLLILGLGLLVPPAVIRDLWLYMEARRAVIALGIALDGNWAIPHNLGDPVLTKPPLFYWIAAAAFRLLDSRAEWIPRLPSLIPALLVPLALARMLSLRWGPGPAAFGGAVLLVLPLYHWMGHMAELDMLFVGTSALAVAAFWEVAAGTSLARFAGPAGFFLLGLSLISKGPVAPLIVFLTLGTWTAVMRPPGFIRRLRPVAGLIVFALPGTLWLLALGYHNIGLGRLLEEIREHVGEDAPHAEGPAFYLHLLRKLMFPWLYLWAGAALAGIASAVTCGGVRALPRRAILGLVGGRGEILLAMLWFVISLIVISAIGSKRYYYAVALTPPIAVLTGILYASLPAIRIAWTRPARGLLAGALCLFLALAFVGAYAAFRAEFRLDPLDGEEEPRDRMLLGLLAAWAGGLAFVLADTLRRKTRRPLARPVFLLTLLAMAGYISVINFMIYPALNATGSQKRAAAEIAALLPPGATLFSLFNCHDLWYYWGETRPVHFTTNAEIYSFVKAHPEAWGVAFAKHFRDLGSSDDWEVVYSGDYLRSSKLHAILFRARTAGSPSPPGRTTPHP